jgi:hypothetical protein
VPPREFEAVLAVEGRSALDIFGSPDAMNLFVRDTLRRHFSGPFGVRTFARALLAGEPDGTTLGLPDRT